MRQLEKFVEKDTGASTKVAGRNPARRKHRSKTFTGCWTCRARHVKCDEDRPVCRRCTDAKIDCQGYGVRLQWDSGRAPAARRTLRSGGTIAIGSLRDTDEDVVGNVAGSPKHSGLAEISCSGTSRRTTTITAIENIASGSNSARNRTRNRSFSSTSSQPIQNQSFAASENTDSFLPFYEPNLPTLDSTEDADWCNRHSVEIAQLPVAVVERTVSADIHGPHQTLHHNMVLSDGAPGNGGDKISTISDNARIPQVTDSSPGSSGRASNGLATKYLNTLPDITHQRQILEFWSVHFCDMILPLAGSFNPLREFFTPIALEGTRATPGSSSAAMAVFHLLCTASAFQLSRTKTDKVERDIFSKLAIYHQNEGLSHLRRNLLTNQREEYVPLLAAVTLCIINETMSVSNPSWRVHFDGAIGWVRTVEPEFWTRSETSCVIYQMFAGLAILGLSPFELDRKGNIREPIIIFQCPKEFYCLDRIYGIPYASLKTINDIDRLSSGLGAQEQARYNTRDLDILEMEMYLDVPGTSTTVRGGQKDLLIYHLNYSFHYATIIYFKRTLRKDLVSEVQSLVEKSLYHLEASILCDPRSYCPALWTAVITAFEISNESLRKRFIILVDKFSNKADFDIWDRVRRTVISLWAVRDNGNGTSDLTWQDFLRLEPSLVLMLV